MRNKLFSALIVTGFAGVGATQVQAATTPVLPPTFGNEDTHAEIIEQLYGSGVTATRVDDDDDQVWSGTFNATAKAIFAKQTQSFGTFDGAYSEVFAATGYGYNVTGSGVVSGDSIVFARKPHSGSTAVLKSDPSLNGKGKDHMVTYVLTGDGFNAPTYLLFWEDLRGVEADDDYQDLVVELVGSGATIIPTPAALGAGLMLVGGALLRRRSA